MRRVGDSYNRRHMALSGHVDIVVGCITNTTDKRPRMNKREGQSTSPNSMYYFR
jgi:hypothetical protein